MYISEWIKNNHTLQVLAIFRNPIGDEGIAAIGRSLDDASISKLHVWMCEITVTGAKLLAEGLINSHIIKSLDIRGNDITVDGAIAILEAAVANGVCQEVKIDYEYMSDDKVEEMMSILEERKRQEVGSILLHDNYYYYHNNRRVIQIVILKMMTLQIVKMITLLHQQKITMEMLQLRYIHWF